MVPFKGSKAVGTRNRDQRGNNRRARTRTAPIRARNNGEQPIGRSRRADYLRIGPRAIAIHDDVADSGRNAASDSIPNRPALRKARLHTTSVDSGVLSLTDDSPAAGLRIPTKSAGDSEWSRPPVPIEVGRGFR
jgi:hypothetical protein